MKPLVKRLTLSKKIFWIKKPKTGVGGGAWNYVMVYKLYSVPLNFLQKLKWYKNEVAEQYRISSMLTSGMLELDTVKSIAPCLSDSHIPAWNTH